MCNSLNKTESATSLWGSLVCGVYTPRPIFVANAFVEQNSAHACAKIKSATLIERIFFGRTLDHGRLPQNCLFGLLLIPYVHFIRMENGILF